MGCRIDGQTGMQREGDERVERSRGERGEVSEAAATKYLSFLLRVSPSVRPRIERGCCCEGGKGRRTMAS